jgi:hypothetical protein
VKRHMLGMTIGCHVDQCDRYSFHLFRMERDFLQPKILDISTSSLMEQFLLVLSTNQPGARTLVSGVEETDTSPEDPIVHLSPMYLVVEPRGKVPC